MADDGIRRDDVAERAAFMARALELAALGRRTTFPNPRVGAVVVRDGVIVGEGFHERAGEPHAEVFALRQAGERARGADLYVTLEPCSHHGRTPPCVGAVRQSGVARVFAAVTDPDPRVAGSGLKQLAEAGVLVEAGLLESAAADLNRGFFSRMRRGRPHVTLKLAASLDGRTAMASGESQWITSEASRADVHRLRAEAGAVLTTSSTVVADDPSLDVRHGIDCPRPPDRIVLDSHGRVPPAAKVWRDDGARRLWIAGTTGDAPNGVTRTISTLGADGRLDPAALLEALGRHEINSVLVECGPTFAGTLLREGLADEVVLYLAPSLLGSAARGLASLPGFERLDQRVRLRFTEVRSVGPDLRITAQPEG